QSFELVDDTASRIYRARPREPPPPRAQPPTTTPGQPQQSHASQQGSAVELFVIHLKHARAADVAGTINSLYGRASFLDNSGRRATLGEELRGNLVPPAGAPPPQAVSGVAGRSATLTGEVTIVPDAGANSLLIR